MEKTVEKCVSFYKDDFPEEAWDTLCSEFEVDPDETSFSAIIMVATMEEEIDE